MIKKSLVWLYSAVTYLLWTVIIVVAAVVLGLRYLVLPNIQEYKDTIAAEASKAAGQRVTIGGIKAGWEGLHPHLDLYQVDLYDQQNRPALQLNHIETSLSWLSLVLGEARLSSIIVHRPTLTIRRETDGTLYIAGISMSGPARPEFPNWLLRQSNVEVLDASVVWQDDLRRAPPLALEKLSLKLSSPAWESFMGRHRFGLRATPSVGASQAIDIRGSLLGKDVSKPEDWQGTIYAKLEGTDIAAWRTWLDYPFDLRQGFGATQFWLEFSEARLDKVTADVLLANVKTRFGHDAPEADLQNLSGRLHWERLTQGQELKADRLRLSTPDGLDMRNGQVRIRSEEIKGTQRMEGNIRLDEVNLEHLASFSGYLPVSQEMRQALIDIAPQGRLTNLDMQWSGDAANPAQYALRGNFAGLGIQPWHGIPGFSNVAGSIDADQSGGTVTLDAQRAMLDLRDILRAPIPADDLSGQVKWTRQKGKLTVKVSNLALASPHLAGTINAEYRYAGVGSGEIDLTGKFGKADGKFATFYYPSVLSKDTLHWLDTSILAARGENVSVILRGKLDEFPWNNSKNGLFEIRGNISDGLLDYATGWPRIEGLKLDMLFRGNRMELNATQGRLLGNQIIKTKAVIPDLDAEHPVLEVTGELQGPAAEAIRFVNNSPVLAAIDHFTEGMQASGTGKLTLGLRIPLDTEGVGTRIKGSYLISNGRLASGDDFPPLENLNGRLEFTESTLRAQNVTTQIFGGPAQFSLENGKDGQLRVMAQGRISDAGIRQAIDLPLADKLSGSADWTGEINIRKHQADLLIRSSLAGISSSLPPPFDKSASSTLPLLIEKKKQGDQQDLLTLSLGSIVNAKLLRQEKRGAMVVDRGEIVFNSTPTTAELPAKPGLTLRGRMDHIDVDQWTTLLASKDHSATSGPSITNAQLAFGTLDVFGRRINNLSLTAKAITDGWQTSLQSREITGDALWLRSGHGKVVARLKSLVAPAAAPAKLSAPEQAEKQDTEYPALDITAEEFEVKQKKLGRLELLASQQGDDWIIERLRISNPDSTLSGTGEWNNWKYRPVTKLNLSWDISDIGNTLQRFGYPDTIKGGNADMTAQLKWPGSPHEFNVAELGGTLQLDARQGQFLKIQPGVGRLFSVLSLQNLPRRLTFDFRDVFSAGFTFDNIGGNVRIDRGIMRSDDFKMEGPAAKVAISGETDLNRETQNLHIKVTPSISDSVSLAAFAGGPAVGAAAWVAQKLLRDPLNKIAAYEYDIIGTWENPQEAKSKNSTPAPAPVPLLPGK